MQQVINDIEEIDTSADWTASNNFDSKYEKTFLKILNEFT